MGWPTKGTGSNYNSHTGFGNLLGAYTKKVMLSHIYCRRCRVCETAKRKKKNPKNMTESKIGKQIHHQSLWRQLLFSI